MSLHTDLFHQVNVSNEEIDDDSRLKLHVAQIENVTIQR